MIFVNGVEHHVCLVGLTAVVTLLIILILCIFVASMSKELIKGIKTVSSYSILNKVCSSFSYHILA